MEQNVQIVDRTCYPKKPLQDPSRWAPSLEPVCKTSRTQANGDQYLGKDYEKTFQNSAGRHQDLNLHHIAHSAAPQHLRSRLSDCPLQKHYRHVEHVQTKIGIRARIVQNQKFSAVGNQEDLNR